jgi:RNA polymerase sigma-B factor
MPDHDVPAEQVDRTLKVLAQSEQLARDRAKASTHQLFAEYQEHRDPAIREALLRRFLPLARRVAFGYASSSEPLDDLLQVATLALLVAIDRFDPDRGFGFPAFAIPTMTGALKRHFRGATWGVHVARGAQERALAIDDATEFLATLNGRAPTLQEIASYLSITVEEVLDGNQVKVAYRSESLDAPANTREGYRESITVGDSIGAEDYGYELVEHKVEIGRALSSLSDLEREVLHLRFVGDMTQLQIAKQVGISQMQVSRVLRRSLERMREEAGATASATAGAALARAAD